MPDEYPDEQFTHVCNREWMHGALRMACDLWPKHPGKHMARDGKGGWYRSPEDNDEAATRPTHDAPTEGATR